MCPSELCLRMMIFSSSKAFFVLIVSFRVAEGTLTPDGTVSVDCGNALTFTCQTPVGIGWNIAGLSGINIPGPFLARIAAMENSRMTSNDTGSDTQTMMSYITISGFSISDNGGIIQCVNKNNNNTKGMATISVDLLPTIVTATVESCNVTLQWDPASELNEITCTPPLAGCTECTASPCTITGLNPSTEYVFTVTLNSGPCRASMNTTTARTDSCGPTKMSGTNNPSPTASSAPLAALVLLLLPIPFLYPLGVLIAQLLFYKDKSYCEVFWCCYCWRKDKSYECNSTELRQPREEAAYQNVPKKKEVITNGDEIKKPKRSTQEQVVPDEAFKRQGGNDGDITDESLQCQGISDGHHERRRSRQRKEEVQYQNVGVAKKKDSVSNGDEVKKPKRSKQENIAANEPVRQQGGKDGVVSTGNVTQQQGNPDGLQYADLDFSEQGTGRNVIHTIEDPVTYAEM